MDNSIPQHSIISPTIQPAAWLSALPLSLTSFPSVISYDTLVNLHYSFTPIIFHPPTHHGECNSFPFVLTSTCVSISQYVQLPRQSSSLLFSSLAKLLVDSHSPELHLPHSVCSPTSTRRCS